MKTLEVQYINPIDATEARLAVSDTSIVSATNEYDVVLNVYDSFDNFLFRKNYKGEDFSFEYSNEEQYYQSLKELIVEEGLNENGVYKFRYHFTNDIFDSLFESSNRFIVTEISADRTELRLNPRSNEDSFIDKFNKFKEYVEIDSVTTDINKYVRESIEKSMTDFYQDNNINNILNGLSFIVNGNQVDLFGFLSPHYTGFQIENIAQNLKQSVLNTQETVTQRLKNTVLQNARVQSLISDYEQNPNDSILREIESTVFSIFKQNVKRIILEEITIVFDNDVEPSVPNN